MDWIKWGLVGALVGIILLPFVLVALAAYLLYRVIIEVREFVNMPSECTSINKASGLCDWGNDCLCWHIYMQTHEAADKATTSIIPPTKYDPYEDTTPVGSSYSWPEYRNPGLVDEGTQPVEAEEEPFPGFSKHGG